MLKAFCRSYFIHKNGVPTVKFVRKVKTSPAVKMFFTYPNVDDICEVNRDDVEIVLPQPNISRRGQIIFDITIITCFVLHKNAKDLAKPKYL